MIGVEVLGMARPRAKNTKLVNELASYLRKIDLATDVVLYWNGKRMFVDSRRVEPCPDVKRFLEYGNPESVSMSFDAPLCDQMYYGEYGWGVQEHVRSLYEKYGYLMEFGHHWNVTGWDL